MRLRRVVTPLALVALLAGCSNSASAKWVGDGGQTGAPLSSASPGSTPAVATNDPAAIAAPADNATDVPTGMTIAFSGGNPAATQVSLVDAAGTAVAGGPGYDPSTWVPKQQLAYATQYTATVTTTEANGKTSTAKSSFTTMAAPSKTVRVQSYIGDGQVVGIAAPLVVVLDHNVVDSKRASVQKRLSVTSTPPQEGSWYWFSAHEIHYRPKAYWQPGTKLLADLRTGGVPFGDDYFGRSDLTVDASVATDSLQITIDGKAHNLVVSQNGTVVKTMPASLGKASTPSSSGHMVIMTRKPSEIFDSSLGTGGTPVNSPGGYRVKVEFTMRLTWGGQFIHAAPWSVKQQGHTNVSHGCTNVSTANAKWIYEHSHVGDPVTVVNTGSKLQFNDGWTDWDLSWDKYLQGSALA
jgi:lipoprotein-anchoring transpeptidase ErfK/SrfK